MGHELGGEKIAGLGINGGQLLCFLLFWAIQFYYIVHGMESIRKLETYTAPLKIVICFVLLVWAQQGWRLGACWTSRRSSSLAARRPASSGVFWPSLTAMVGFWATLALNIPDFTRFAKTQRDQVIGQSIGLPVPMGLLAMLAVIVTSAPWSCTARPSGTRSTWPAA
jgi:NCS1 family nucleobase:cation symporter-1